MSGDYRIALCTCPDEATARELASAVVDRRLAACVNIVPGLTSVFAWEGKVETDPEVLLVIKTTGKAWAALEAALVELHPYELPEVIAVEISAGLAGYLQWMDESTESSE